MTKSGFAFILFAAVALAQTPAPKPETPPDETALSAARKVENPPQKLAALEDILKKYPTTKLEASVRMEIFRTALKARPTDRAFIMDSAKRVLKANSKENRRNAYNNLASALLDENLFLNDAEKFARKSLDGYKQKEYFAEQRARAEKSKRKPPTDAEMQSSFDSARSAPLQTVGLLAVKQGRPEEGRKMLEEVLRSNPLAARPLVTLAELAEKDGDEAKALDHLLIAKLSGRIPENKLGDLNRLYTKKHGSVDTMEAKLDELYKSRFPSPLHVSRYEPTADRSKRVVLAEFFTGSGCPPCASADLAFDAVLERYSRDEVALIVYHQHIPAPDPMAFPTARKRFDFYKRGGVPTFVIDGDKDGGGGPRNTAPETYGRINPKIEKRLSEPATATIALKAQREGETIAVKVGVEPITGDTRDLRLHVVLVEESLRYSGENGIRFHPMVARSIAGPETAEGFKLEGGRKHESEWSFNIPTIVSALKTHLDDYEVNGRQTKFKFTEKMHEINPSRLAVIAFVQDAGSGAVLQSSFVRPATVAAEVK